MQTCDPNPGKKYTKKYLKHEPISFSYYIKCFDDNVFKPRLRSYIGEDAVQKFVEWLENDVKEIANIPEVDMIFGKKEAERYNKETKCWICKGELNNDKVRDHCHFTGRYRGAAHNKCNLNYRKPNFTPVVFHNLSGYDSHLFIKNLGFSQGNIDCIPNNEERYISFTKSIEVGGYTSKEGENKPLHHKIRFIDSFKFMAESLDSLVNNLPEDAFNNLKIYYTGDKLSLVMRKGVYPYEYMDSLERLKETQLPPREAFYSRLNDEGISDEDYAHAQKVWRVFKMEHFKDYHNLYNETDVLLLADVFENFRDICNKNYKLIPNLWNKKKYVVHYENLKQYLSLGLKLTNIYRGIRFEESQWLEKYITLNTNLRMEAKNEFEKDFFKLMNNSVFGKTMENIKNRVNIKLVNDKKQAEKLSAKPNFNHCNIFSEDLVAIHMKKIKLHFNKSVYLGMCILDSSKTLMYEFHYNYIKKKYGDKAKLLFTDTDSLMYEIQTEDFYKDISADVKHRFDTSDYPPNHPSGIPSGFNKKVLGVFKDEVKGKVIDEFVGLRAKLYSYKMFEGKESKECKGIKKAVVKNSITHANYKTCLFTRKEQLQKMNVIRSYKHEVYTETVNKIALSPSDDKRYILEDQTHTLALGHYKI